MIARLSVDTGLAPSELANHDVQMLATIADEARDRNERRSWNQTDELLAMLLELLSVFRREVLMTHGVKTRYLPEVIHISRPGEKPSGPRRMSAAEFARDIGKVAI